MSSLISTQKFGNGCGKQVGELSTVCEVETTLSPPDLYLKLDFSVKERVFMKDVTCNLQRVLI